MDAKGAGWRPFFREKSRLCPPFFRTRNATAHADPKGDGQDDRRFPMGQDVPSENPCAPRGAGRGLDLQAILFGHFLLGQQEKVTRPPEAGRSSASSRHTKGAIYAPLKEVILTRHFSGEGRVSLTPFFYTFLDNENGVRLTSEPDPAFLTQLSVTLTRTCYTRNSSRSRTRPSAPGPWSSTCGTWSRSAGNSRRRR